MAGRAELSVLRPGSRVFVLYDAEERLYHERLLFSRINPSRYTTATPDLDIYEKDLVVLVVVAHICGPRGGTPAAIVRQPRYPFNAGGLTAERDSSRGRCRGAPRASLGARTCSRLRDGEGRCSGRVCSGGHVCSFFDLEHVQLNGCFMTKLKQEYPAGLCRVIASSFTAPRSAQSVNRLWLVFRALPAQCSGRGSVAAGACSEHGEC